MILIQLALSAACPIIRGYLLDTDCRWDIISASVDDRTKEERGIEVRTKEGRGVKVRTDERTQVLCVPGHANQQHDSKHMLFMFDFSEILLFIVCEHISCTVV